MIGQLILGRRVFVTKGEDSNEFNYIVVELMTDFFDKPSIAWN